MQTRKPVLLVTKGHAFEREPFFRFIDAVAASANLRFTHVEQPAAQSLLTPEGAADYEAIVFYDMPGVRFVKADPPFETYDPSDAHKAAFLALANAGKGMVFLHHAVASWPTWPAFSKIVGARFHFLPGTLGERAYPGSGYRFNVPQNIEVLEPTHAIADGLPASFPITDEAYLYPVLEDEVTPLLRSDFEFVPSKFRWGGVGFKDHPEGSKLVGWTKVSGASPVAYLQFGHGPSAYESPFFQRLLSNAIHWASSKAALDDARERAAPLPLSA